MVIAAETGKLQIITPNEIMMITPANAMYYLIERGFLTYESAVDGDLMILGGASNHRNIKVIRKQQPGYFIKQVQKWEISAIGSLQREAACYWLGHNDNDFASLTSFLPKYYTYDLNRHLLIIELLPDGESLFEYCSRLQAFPAGLSSRIGTALGTYHREAGAKMKQGAQSATLSKTIPWILTVHQLLPAQSNFNAASQELLTFIQSNPQFHYNLDNLQKQWRSDSFIHGDIKLDNYIIEPPDESGKEFSFKIIDWELAGFGDAGWDLGSAFQALISFPVISLPSAGNPLPQHLSELLQLCSPEIRASIRELWIGYVGTLPVNDPAIGEYLERSVRYCAARLLQTALECTETLKGGEPAYYSDLLKAKAFCLTVVALGIFQNPIYALSSLFAG